MQEQVRASTTRPEGRGRAGQVVDREVGTNHSVAVLVVPEAWAAKLVVVTTLVAGTLIHRLVK
jgi:biotin-(acetyl-CoA carboxylase) ligase